MGSSGSTKSKQDDSGTRAEAHGAWSISRRRMVSVALLGYLFLLLAGPLANPVGSENLTRPVAQAVSPFHQALFMGHGYRFFGPDPGNSHLVEFEITQSDGSKIRGHFPDRDQTWPRLLYHRWFMLSETIFSEHSLTPSEEDFALQQQAILNESRQLKLTGDHDRAAMLVEERSRLKTEYDATRKRIDMLVKGVARGLMSIHGDEESRQIELFVREREIPFPQEVQSGVKLDDPKFLVPQQPPKIGSFTSDQLASEPAVVPAELPSRGGEQ